MSSTDATTPGSPDSFEEPARSECEAEVSDVANSFVPNSSLTSALSAQSIEPQIDHLSFRNALAIPYPIPVQRQTAPQSTSSYNTIYSSMAASVENRRTIGTNSGVGSTCPSLIACSSLGSSASVARGQPFSNRGRRHTAARPAYRLSIGENDIGELPASEYDPGSECKLEAHVGLDAPSYRDDVLACQFKFLGCQSTFHNVDEWNTHCCTHFRDLPAHMKCPFANCNWSITALNGSEAWDRRSQHVRGTHKKSGVVDATSRPYTPLVRHLWSTRVITDGQFRELRSKGKLAEDGPPVIRSSGRIRDRRHDRTRRPV